jgi:hypothetical protein
VDRISRCTQKVIWSRGCIGIVLLYASLSGCRSLENRLLSDDDYVRARATRDVGGLDERSAYFLIRKLTVRIRSDLDPKLLARAVEALLAMRLPVAERELGRTFFEASQATQNAICEVVERHCERAVELFARWAQDSSASSAKVLLVGRLAAIARRGGSASCDPERLRRATVEAFGTLVATKDRETRLLALAQLPALGSEAIAMSLPLLYDDDLEIRKAAFLVLPELGSAGLELLGREIVWALWRADPALSAALDALARFGNDARPTFEAVLGNPSIPRRSDVLRAATKLGEMAVPLLMPFASGTDSDLRSEALESLAQLGTPGLEAIGSLLSAPSERVFRAALSQLERIGPASARILDKALDEVPPKRIAPVERVLEKVDPTGEYSHPPPPPGVDPVQHFLSLCVNDCIRKFFRRASKATEFARTICEEQLVFPLLNEAMYRYRLCVYYTPMGRSACDLYVLSQFASAAKRAAEVVCPRVPKVEGTAWEAFIRRAAW